MDLMNGDDWRSLLAVIPPMVMNEFVLVLKTGAEINIGEMIRNEPKYLVVRGRQGGNVDENRAFFVPYENLNYIRWEKIVKQDELRELYGDTSMSGIRNPLDADEPPPATELLARPPLPPLQPTTADAPPAGTLAARNNLLERIRAARASTGGR